ncbi:MAG TPA: GxxExxY protein [Phycisphaerae bacterium]|nr:GxxExxY protein [Phycisphaerae bacterium]HNU44218.1 GxxExxY protein [Phycisphaerae bacterium]
MTIDQLTEKVIGCAYRVHNELGAGFLEKVYENALRIELAEAGLRVQQQHPIPVVYHGEVVGEYFADLMVEDCLIVELKAVQSVGKEHEVQLVNYLAATGIDDGVLINFGSSVQVKRKFRRYKERAPSSAVAPGRAPAGTGAQPIAGSVVEGQ